MGGRSYTALMQTDEEILAEKFAVVLPHLDERQRRILLAAEARALGRGGVSLVARAAGVSRQTIHTALEEPDAPPAPAGGRVRRPGGGRKRLAERDPGLADALDALVEPTSRGDPESPLRWTTKSTRNLADTLTEGATRPATRWSRACCASRATARRRPARPWKAPSTPTGMPSSAPSTTPPAATSTRACRWSASTPRRRSWPATSPTPAANGSQPARRSR